MRRHDVVDAAMVLNNGKISYIYKNKYNNFRNNSNKRYTLKFVLKNGRI